MRDTILETKELDLSFGSIQAVKQVSIQIPSGQVTALVGDNGAGKSTLIKILTGALKKDAGEIWVRGNLEEINDPSDAFRLGIAAVYQDLALIENRNVVMNMFLGMELTHGPFNLFLDHKKMLRESQNLLDEIHSRIPSATEVVRKLSGGQRQAVAVGRILLRGSEIIIMDEPTAALGVEQTQEVLQLIKSLRANGKTVILISHNINQVFEVADQISVMFNGELIGSRFVNDTRPEQIISMIMGRNNS